MGRKLHKTPYSDEMYTNVLAMVRNGIPILEAIKDTAMCQVTFYKNTTKAQKAELRLAKLKTVYSDEMYPKVLAMVETGYTIEKATNILGISRQTFSYHLTKNQKAELKIAKVAHAGKNYVPKIIQ